MVLERALRAQPIQIATPAGASGSMLLFRSQGVVLSEIQPHVDAVLLGAEQRLDDSGASRQAVRLSRILRLGVVDRAGS
jgi:hypothetical protein